MRWYKQKEQRGWVSVGGDPRALMESKASGREGESRGGRGIEGTPRGDDLLIVDELTRGKSIQTLHVGFYTTDTIILRKMSTFN